MTGAHCRQHSAVNLKTAVENKTQALRFQTLGVASSTAYELMHEKNFPAVRIGNRFVVPKEEFQTWIKKKIGGKCND